MYKKEGSVNCDRAFCMYNYNYIGLYCCLTEKDKGLEAYEYIEIIIISIIYSKMYAINNWDIFKKRGGSKC